MKTPIQLMTEIQSGAATSIMYRATPASFLRHVVTDNALAADNVMCVLGKHVAQDLFCALRAEGAVADTKSQLFQGLMGHYQNTLILTDQRMMPLVDPDSAYLVITNEQNQITLIHEFQIRSVEFWACMPEIANQ